MTPPTPLFVLELLNTQPTDPYPVESLAAWIAYGAGFGAFLLFVLKVI